MSSLILRSGARLFDRLEEVWESLATQRSIAGALIWIYVVGLAVIEAGRRGWLSERLAEYVPTSHFEALHIAFTVLLLLEAVALIMGLASSVANAAGKQFEIMSLILLRQSFKELKSLPEPIGEGQVVDVVPAILSDVSGAIVIFVLLGIYYGMQRHVPISEDPDARASFIAAKKTIALAMLASLALNGMQAVTAFGQHPFFEVFYTQLIFVDVLIVLISLRYSTAYHVVFRYFGFAVTTMLIRLALSAPRFLDAALGIAATLLAVALTWIYNRYAPRLATAVGAPED